MPQFETVRRVAFSPAQMFAVVSDVEDYPRFVPMCEALTVLSRTANADGTAVIIARMTAGYKAIHESFTTRVTVNPAVPAVDVAYLDGPFHHLDNRWRFLPVEDAGCEVKFWIDYQFKSPLLALVMGAMFDKAFRKFSESFEERARVRYGASKRAEPPPVIGG